MREIIQLNFNWLFNPNYVEDHIKELSSLDGFINVDIPHTDLEIPLNYIPKGFNERISTYKKEIDIKEEYKNKVLKLVFEGVAHLSNIYINNKFVMTHEGGYDEFHLLINDYVNYGETNYLTLVVNNKENPNIPPFGNVVDYLGYGGIYREVRLEILEKEHIINCFISCPNIEQDIIKCKTEITPNVEGVLELSILEKDREVLNKKINIYGNDISIDFSIYNKTLWTLENPYMYSLKMKLIVNDIIKDIFQTRFGIREAVFTKEGFFLNKKHIKLRGLNRHQSYPYVGYAMPRSVQEKDADILKFELGVNIVRTSHYMQSKHFLNRCDEIGLLVLEEIPGWQYIGSERFKENSYRNIEAMIKRDFNHPSIVTWGVRINESPDDNDFYSKTNKIAHYLDTTRPTCGVRNFINSNMYEDIYTFNDFIHSGENKALRNPQNVKKNVPYLVTEHNGHMFPTKKFDDEKHRVSQALRHYRVIDESYKYDRLAGVIGWCMNDYNTHEEFGSGDMVCHHGVLDMFRLPKYASYIYSSQQENKPVMEVLSTINYGDYPASVTEGIYVATNVDYVKLYKDGEYIKTFYPDTTSKVPHPLVYINDFIGDQLVNKEGFSKRDSERCKKIFFAVSKYGYNLPIKYKLLLLIFMINNKLKLNQAVDLYFKYNFGSFSYSFEGYKNDKLVKTVLKENVRTIKYKLTLDKKELFVSDTYDAVRVVLTKLDQNDNILNYSFDAALIEVTGGIELIGPNQISLIAGSIAFWVKTKGDSDFGIILVKVGNQELREKVTIKRG